IKVDLRRGVGRLLCRGLAGLASRPCDSRAWRLPTANGLPIPNSGKDMDSLMDLTGKNALVTGAGQGVGRATALLFAQAGASRSEVIKSDLQSLMRISYCD